MTDQTSKVVSRAWRIACKWRTPPHWESIEWREELKSVAYLAGFDADTFYDSMQHGDYSHYLFSRVLGALQTHHRREWRYQVRCCVHLPSGGSVHDRVVPTDDFADCLSLMDVDALESRLWVQHCIEHLDARDRELLMALYFDGLTESMLAHRWGVSQSAISQRKRSVLKRLRALLNDVWAGGG